MNWLRNFFKKKRCLVPPADVPLTDIPGNLLNARYEYTSQGQIRMVESKFNMAEYERLKPIIKRIMK